jgi:flagellar FliL protein
MKISALLSGLVPKAFRKKPPVDTGEDDEAIVAVPAAPAPFPTLISWLVAMGGMSAVAIGLGAVVGLLMISTARHDASAQVARDAQAGSDIRLINLPPIITNLAAPASAWVRLQTAIVVDKNSAAESDVLAAEIADDILGFMKTVTLAQIAGASGLQHLREDLTERAVIRSDGHVHELILQTLVVQ